MPNFKSWGAPLLASALVCVMSAPSWAQQVRIVYPQQGQDVRGEVTVRYEGLPPGGYAIIKLNDQFKQASAQDFVVFDTISDRATFTRGDGQYKIDITVLRPGGGQVGTDSVTFNVANNKVDVAGESVKLTHWKPTDILDDTVERYRVFAESNATIIDGADAGGGGGGAAAGGGGGGGGAGGEASYIPAPLDWQVSALMRRLVRNIGMYNNSANIATTVQESFERQRLSETGAAGEGGATAAPTTAKRGKTPVSTVPVKAPWNQSDNGQPLWNKANETGKFFVKMIQQNGTEVNATRKGPTIAIADLLPTFPDSPVRPGSTWETNMTILGDLSSRKGVNVTAPITFTAYDTILTPGGESRRAAKLESRFRLPENKAKEIAANLANKVGTAGGAGGGGGAAPVATGGGDAGAAETLITPADIEVARADVARVLWFDMDRRQVLRSEDTIKSYFEIPPAATDAGGGGGAAMGGGDAGGAAAPAEPTKVSYNLGVTTWFDDRVPAPTAQYNNGLGTAHSKDSVNEPGISRITQGTKR